MKRFLAVYLTTLVLSLSVAAQEHTRPPKSTTPPRAPNVPATPPGTTPGTADPAWTKFTSQEGRFSVLMPGTPKYTVETTPSDHGPYTTHLLTLRAPRNVFLIGWVDYDPSFNFNLQSELEMNRDNFVRGVKARLLDTRTTMIDGYRAIEFTAEAPLRIFKSRVYMVGRRPYQIVIGTPKGEDDSAEVARFFKSFKVSPY